MKNWKVYTAKTTIMTVIATDMEHAIRAAEKALNRKGREQIYNRWIADGKIVAEA